MKSQINSKPYKRYVRIWGGVYPVTWQSNMNKTRKRQGDKPWIFSREKQEDKELHLKWGRDGTEGRILYATERDFLQGVISGTFYSIKQFLERNDNYILKRRCKLRKNSFSVFYVDNDGYKQYAVTYFEELPNEE